MAMAVELAVAIAGAVASELLSLGRDLLRGDPEKRAFQAAVHEAGREMFRAHPELRKDKVLKPFLTGPARPILARTLLLDDYPTPAELADAYLAQFPAGGPPLDRETANQLAGEFLIRLHLALRRQRDLRAVFDSKALDAAARYLYQLLEESQLAWVRQRELAVTEALGMYGGAARIYEYAAGEYLRPEGAPEWIEQGIVVPAYRLTGDAAIRLQRIGYSDAERLQQEWTDLVEDRYVALAQATQSLQVPRARHLRSGIEEFQALLATLAPL